MHRIYQEIIIKSCLSIETERERVKRKTNRSTCNLKRFYALQVLSAEVRPFVIEIRCAMLVQVQTRMDHFTVALRMALHLHSNRSADSHHPKKKKEKPLSLCGGQNSPNSAFGNHVKLQKKKMRTVNTRI